MKKHRALPKHVEVLGVNVSVRLRSEKRDKNLKDCWGYFDQAAASIVIDADCANDMKFHVLHHELGHAFLHYSGAMFVLQTVIRDRATLEYVEESLIRGAMVPHSMTCARHANPG